MWLKQQLQVSADLLRSLQVKRCAPWVKNLLKDHESHKNSHGAISWRRSSAEFSPHKMCVCRSSFEPNSLCVQYQLNKFGKTILETKHYTDVFYYLSSVHDCIKFEIKHSRYEQSQDFQL